MRRLSPLVRTVLWLHQVEGWTHAELGRRFGRSESWSKSLVARALDRLRVAAGSGALVLAAVLVLPALSPPGDDASPALAPVAVPAPAPDPTLQALDDSLQAAYARGASDAELAPLWLARRQALSDRRNPS